MENEILRVDGGCNYPIGKTKRWNAKENHWQDVRLYCNKLRAWRDEYFPKHRLIADDALLDASRRAKKAAATKKFQREQEECLKSSPPAAVNPKFSEKGTGYER